ncbi:hypothetical protein EXE58_15540 [Nocardioides seonyuensis]|uniref:Uncharacterized protein n=1 Tax=Nocardioides seonyuensis TaxID=2518371 RepID=A0A4P7IJ43_9ACTN|nr:hypothetical protein [Nocardioides seonyuensis]QBX56730.1 hypothetical protein EXE58_15540 [Nocardioides seonyuensis]
MTAATTLLSRLVERQRTHQPSLRPLLSSRFEPLAGEPDAPGDGLVEKEELVLAPPVQHLPSRESASPPLPSVAEPVVARAPGMVGGVGRIEPAPGSETARVQRIDRTSTPPTYDEQVVVRPEPAGEHRAPSRPAIAVEAPQEEHPTTARRLTPRHGDPAPRVESMSTPLPAPLVDAKTRQASAHAEAARPERPGERVVGAPSPATRQPPVQQPPVEQPLTVSVRIGRIEVRAPAEQKAAPAGAAARPTRPEPRLSLEDYLARPRRGWS